MTKQVKPRLAFLLKARNVTGKYGADDNRLVVRAELVMLSDDDGKPRNITPSRWDGTEGLGGIVVQHEVKERWARNGDGGSAEVRFEYGESADIFEAFESGKVAAKIKRGLDKIEAALGPGPSIGELTARVATVLSVKDFTILPAGISYYPDADFQFISATHAASWLNEQVTDYVARQQGVTA